MAQENWHLKLTIAIIKLISSKTDIVLWLINDNVTLYKCLYIEQVENMDQWAIW